MSAERGTRGALCAGSTCPVQRTRGRAHSLLGNWLVDCGAIMERPRQAWQAPAHLPAPPAGRWPARCRCCRCRRQGAGRRGRWPGCQHAGLRRQVVGNVSCGVTIVRWSASRARGSAAAVSSWERSFYFRVRCQFHVLQRAAREDTRRGNGCTGRNACSVPLSGTGLGHQRRARRPVQSSPLTLRSVRKALMTFCMHASPPSFSMQSCECKHGHGVAQHTHPQARAWEKSVR